MKKIIIEDEKSKIHLSEIKNDSDDVILIKKNNDIVGSVFREPGGNKWMLRVSGSYNTKEYELKELIDRFSKYDYEFYVLD